MSLLYMLAAAAFLVSRVDGACQFPDELVGSWKGNAWTDLTITTSNFGPLTIDTRSFTYECYLRDGSRYAIRSPEYTMHSLKWHIYICLNISTAPDNNDVLYYYLGTESNADLSNDPAIAFSIVQNPTPNMTDICTRTEDPEVYDFNFLLKEGWESRLPAGSCPDQLEATFEANFVGNTTTQMMNCTDFPVDGCGSMKRDLTLNFTTCDMGAVTYKCVFNMMGEMDTTYSLLYMEPMQGQDNPYAPYSCLEQTEVNGTMTIVHRAGTCGGTPSESMVLGNKGMCPVIATTLAPDEETTATTPSGISNSTESNDTDSGTTTSSGGNGGQGGGGNGDVSDGGNAGSVVHAGVLSLITALFFALIALP